MSLSFSLGLGSFAETKFFLPLCAYLGDCLLSLLMVLFLTMLEQIRPLPSSHSVKKPKTMPVSANRMTLFLEFFWICVNLDSLTWNVQKLFSFFRSSDINSLGSGFFCSGILLSNDNYQEIRVSMSQVSPSRMSKLYRSTIFQSYLFGFMGFMLGVKSCDWLMYDPKPHQIEMELMEDQFWKINGEPKYLKPQLVESVVRPGTVRKSWIQIVYGKDSYVSKEQAED